MPVDAVLRCSPSFERVWPAIGDQGESRGRQPPHPSSRRQSVAEPEGLTSELAIATQSGRRECPVGCRSCATYRDRSLPVACPRCLPLAPARHQPRHQQTGVSRGSAGEHTRIALYQGQRHSTWEVETRPSSSYPEVRGLGDRVGVDTRLGCLGPAALQRRRGPP